MKNYFHYLKSERRTFFINYPKESKKLEKFDHFDNLTLIF